MGEQGSRRRELLRNFLHLAALSSFAIAQQYFNPLGKSAGYLVEAGASGGEVVAFALTLLIAPPLLLTLVEGIASLVRRSLVPVLQVVFVTGLVGLFAWQRVNDANTHLPAPVVIAIGLAIGTLAGLAYARMAVVRTYVSVLALAPLLFLVMFLVFSPVRSLVFGGQGDPPARVPLSGAPVVMLVLDEFPVASLVDARGRIDARQYPSFARLAHDATWYAKATTVADFTEMAVPALVTGITPSHRTLPVAAEHPRGLFTLLGGSYRMDVAEQVTALCDEPACPEQPRVGGVNEVRNLLAGAVARIPVLPSWARGRIADVIAPASEPVVLRPRYGRSVRRQLTKGTELNFGGSLGGIDAGRRVLHLVHILKPHRPWGFLPSGQQYPHARPDFTGSFYSRWPRDRWETKLAWQRHLLQAEMTDRLLGRLIARLKAVGTYDQSLIVVTADHGASFRPGDASRRVTKTNVQDIAYVPLFIKRPDQRRGEVDRSPVRTTDVLPTIASDLHTRVPWRIDGRPAGDVHGGGGRDVVSVHRYYEGGAIALDRRALERRWRASLRHERRLFPARRGDRPLYEIGPTRGLLGRRVSELPRSAVAGRASVDSPGAYERVDPRAHTLPVNVTGDLHGGPQRRRALAIAVNGVIRVTTWTLKSPHAGWYYSALIPPRALSAGPNRIAVFGVERSASGVALAPLSARPAGG